MSNFKIPANSSLAEIEAIVEEGMDAMFDAYEAGEDVPNVAFLHEQAPVVEEEDEDIKEDVTPVIPADEIEESCPVCGEDPCLFLQHAEMLLAFEEAELAGLAPEDVPPNNLRRKALYRQMTLLINGGPLGAKVRKQLPDCVVNGIREMLPSDSFMGFHAAEAENQQQEEE
jgi:hypothetical protein